MPTNHIDESRILNVDISYVNTSNVYELEESKTEFATYSEPNSLSDNIQTFQPELTMEFLGYSRIFLLSRHYDLKKIYRL